jgi:hypothetical protein
MPSFTLTLSPEHAIRLLDAFGADYQATIPDPGTGLPIPNPQTKTEFAEQRLRLHIKRYVTAYETEAARNAITVTDIDIT